LNATQAQVLAVRPGLRTVVIVALTIGCLVLACGASLLVAMGNVAYFDVVQRLVRADTAIPRALLFSSWLLLVGGALVVWRPSTFGFQLGDISRHWRLIAGVAVAAMTVTAVVITLTGPTPYSDASLLVESLVVPVTEELVFRGVLLTALVVALGRLHPHRAAMVLAVIFDGLAFGLGHIANATELELGFVLSQVTFASFLGVGCAYLVVRTRSIYPAMFLHAVVNGVVVIL
jgi:membrane protease YdiL (CAAX protease family)